jgi:hypothetical protein
MKLVHTFTLSALLVMVNAFGVRPASQHVDIDITVQIDPPHPGAHVGKSRLTPIAPMSELECGQDNFYYECSGGEDVYSPCSENCVCTTKGKLECYNPCDASELKLLLSQDESSTDGRDVNMKRKVDKEFTEYCGGGPSCFCY